MKNLIIALTLVLSPIVVSAEEVPSYLKDATITVTLKNGKTYTYSANEYKVVKRGSQPAPVVNQAASETSKKEYNGEYRNRLTLHVGVASDGNDVKQYPNHVEVDERKKAAGAIQLQHRFKNSRWSGSGQLQTNEAGFLGVGYDF